LPQTARYLKVPLIGLNAILWLLGLVLVIIGGVGVTFFSNFKNFVEATDATSELKNLSVSLPAGVLSIGVFFIILTIIGCAAAYKERLVMLVFYSVLMLVLLVVLIGIGSEAVTYHNDNIGEIVGENWLHVSKSNESKQITTLETFLECCGWNSVDPYTYLCENATAGVPKYKGIYCEDVLTEAISSKLYLVGVTGVIIGVIEFIAMLFALFMIIRICRT
ncbi:hypothetical protein DICPUDRAFT_21115, partial [Dictyostelium purpureum]